MIHIGTYQFIFLTDMQLQSNDKIIVVFQRRPSVVHLSLIEEMAFIEQILERKISFFLAKEKEKPLVVT